MALPEGVRCENCDYFHEFDATTGKGECWGWPRQFDPVKSKELIDSQAAEDANAAALFFTCWRLPLTVKTHACPHFQQTTTEQAGMQR